MTIDWAMALSLETQNGTPVFRLQISHICLRDMESSVGWLCRHSSDNQIMFLCVSVFKPVLSIFSFFLCASIALKVFKSVLCFDYYYWFGW